MGSGAQGLPLAETAPHSHSWRLGCIKKGLFYVVRRGTGEHLLDTENKTSLLSPHPHTPEAGPLIQKICRLTITGSSGEALLASKLKVCLLAKLAVLSSLFQTHPGAVGRNCLHGHLHLCWTTL